MKRYEISRTTGRSMKYWIFPGVAVLLGLAAGFISTAIEFSGNRELFVIRFYPKGVPEKIGEFKVGNSPKVNVVNGAVHDFGSMEKKETKTHAFTFRNDGLAPLEIHVLNTTCKCTLSDVRAATIEPGESLDVTLEWKPDNYSMDFSQTATIKTNDPLHDLVELRVKGQVIQPLWSFPEKLIITNILSSEGFNEDIYVLSREEHLNIESLELQDAYSKEFFDISYEKVEDADFLNEQGAKAGFKINVIANPGLPLEPLLQLLVVETNLEDMEPMELQVRGFVRGDITIKASQQYAYDSLRNTLDFGLVQQSEEIDTRIGLMVRGEHAGNLEFWIEEDGIHPSNIISAELEDSRGVGKLQMIPLRLRLKKGSPVVDFLGPKRENMGRIEIMTNHPVDKKVVLYVRFGIQG